jgi:hypothetical protein
MRWTKRPGLRLHLLHQRLQRIQRLLPHDPERQWWAAVVPKAAVVAVRPAEDAVVLTAVLRQTERQDHLPALLSRCMSDKSAELLQRRFSKALQGVDIINTLCAQPLVLREWSFLGEHCYTITRLLGAFTGFAGVQMCPPDPQNFLQIVSQPTPVEDEAPFLNTIFFLMISRELPPLALARCLVRARFGFWLDDRRVFFPSYRYPGPGLANRWGLVTKEANDLGTVHVTFEGERIVSFRFSHAWPKARFRNGRSHFMGKEFFS